MTRSILWAYSLLGWVFALGTETDVYKRQIYDRIRGIGGAVMPPPPPKGEGPWQQSRIELFAKWMADGFQP